MTREEYQAAIKAADLEHRKATNAIKRQYADAHGIAKIGDKVAEYDRVIIVDVVLFSTFLSAGSIPYHVYGGYLLKKGGNPRADKQRAALANLGKLVNLSAGEQE